jgi:hypothetical protein
MLLSIFMFGNESHVDLHVRKAKYSHCYLCVQAMYVRSGFA